MRRIIIMTCVVAALLACVATTAWGASVTSIDPASSVAVNDSTFTVKVVVTGAYPGSHYVTVSMAGSGGFSVQTGAQGIAHLSAGATKTLVFKVRAPSASSSGRLSVTSKWSNNYSGSGTYLTSQRAQPISCNAGWTVSVQLLHPGGFLAGDPTYWTVTNSWRYSSTKGSSSAPYYVTFTVPATSATYTIIGTWWIYAPWGKSPCGATKTVYISRSGTVITF